jgi:hypothetical protein
MPRFAPTLRHHEVFDANSLASKAIRHARYITGCEDTRYACLVLIHDRAAINRETWLCCQ